MNRGVILAPTLTSGEGVVDCLVHLGFDLTHCWLCSFDSLIIHDFQVCAVCLCHFADWSFSGVLCEFLWRFGGLCLTLVARCAKTTRPRTIYTRPRRIKRDLMTHKPSNMLVSNPEDTTDTLRGISYYKKRKHIYKRFFNRFLSVLRRFTRYKLLFLVIPTDCFHKGNQLLFDLTYFHSN